MNEVIITRKRFDDDVDGTGSSWLEYTCGDVVMLWEDNDFEFLSLGKGPESLSNLHTLLSDPRVQVLMGQPETARAAVAAALDNPNRMPTAAETFDLIIEDRISGWLWWRAVEWAKLRIEQGYDVGKSAASVKHAQRFDRLLVKTVTALDKNKPMGDLAIWFMTITGWEKRYNAA